MPMLRNIKITTTITTRLEVSGSATEAAHQPIDTTVSRTVTAENHAIIATLPGHLDAHFGHAFNLLTDQLEPAYEEQFRGNV